MDALDLRLLNDFQRGFPLVPQPFQAIAGRLGCDEAQVLARLRRLHAGGAVSRVGAVFAPLKVGASTLAALAAPPERLAEVAAIVNGYAEVNHNYEREHAFNLWFVATAPDAAWLAQVLADIERATGCPVLSLPLLREFHIDLGFDLNGAGKVAPHPAMPAAPLAAQNFTAAERRLIAALEPGLELLPRPYSRLAMRAGLTEADVIARIGAWLAQGTLKRFGVVVRHRELGWTANAMCVFDVPDALVDEFGPRLAATPEVTLCYRRRRALPHWPYNLFCMIHGRSRAEVEAVLEGARAGLGLARYDQAVLFSRRRFKQRGARYTAPTQAGHG
jgi:DNA-binding Lrp family transcriptional regulator